MATGFGIDASLVTDVAKGNELRGTTSSDIRRILGGLYTPGVISGGSVITNTTNMTYSVTSGVGVIKWAAGESVLVAWDAAPSVVPSVLTTPRTDYVYVVQNPKEDATRVSGKITSGTDKGSQLEVKVSNSFPQTGALLLGTYTVKAGAVATSDGVRTGSVDYSIPYGASLGVIAKDQDTANGPFTTRQTIVSRSIYLPTDRLVSFNLQTVASAVGASGFSGNTYCEASYGLSIDGIQYANWRSPGLHQAGVFMNFEERVNLTAGTHLVTLTRGREVGPGTPYQHYGKGNFPGAALSIIDAGVVR